MRGVGKKGLPVMGKALLIVPAREEERPHEKPISKTIRFRSGQIRINGPDGAVSPLSGRMNFVKPGGSVPGLTYSGRIC